MSCSGEQARIDTPRSVCAAEVPRVEAAREIQRKRFEGALCLSPDSEIGADDRGFGGEQRIRRIRDDPDGAFQGGDPVPAKKAVLNLVGNPIAAKRRLC